MSGQRIIIQLLRMCTSRDYVSASVGESLTDTDWCKLTLQGRVSVQRWTSSSGIHSRSLHTLLSQAVLVLAVKFTYRDPSKRLQMALIVTTRNPSSCSRALKLWTLIATACLSAATISLTAADCGGLDRTEFHHCNFLNPTLVLHW